MPPAIPTPRRAPPPPPPSQQQPSQQPPPPPPPQQQQHPPPPQQLTVEGLGLTRATLAAMVGAQLHPLPPSGLPAPRASASDAVTSILEPFHLRAASAALRGGQ
jgi:hypothetical protein